MVEAEHSFLSQLHNKTAPWADIWPALAEVGANVGVIMILALALRVLCGQGKIESDKK